ncbi:hypothetical protein SASPL_156774 [Salvia splendens]|uniref:Uncharacterized protein n=1 Tax=Salvia splendens TaxID=180675 RepID=A0A8X8YVD2_SALSN|nr:hypothetical protein SASPL_156774 [Salvia splendens]
MKRVWKCRRKDLGSVVVRRMPRCHRWSASATAAGLPEGRKSGLRSISYFFMVGLRYRGNSLGLSSVSNFRTGRMPSVNRMIENLSDWDIDTSDSEGGGYGGRDSPKASPRDDKVANGGARHIYFANAPGNYNDRVVVGHHDSARVGLGNWLRNILLKSEEKLTRKDHSELVGEGAYVKSKKTIGKIRVQVRNVKMGTEQPTGFTFTSLKSSSTGKLETFQQRSVAHLIVGTRGYLKEVPHANKAHQLMNWCKVADISDESVLDLDLMGRSVVSVLYPGKKSMKKLRKIQLYINYSTIADKDSYKIPSFGESGITNYVLRPVHICSRNYRLRLCFGDCDERPTVSAQKLVATWFVEMVGGFICIFSGVLDAYTKLRYLSYVMDISTATVDYLDLVHDILLPVVIKDKSPFSERRLAAPALDPALKLYKWLHDILSPSGLGNWLRNILLKSEEKLTRKDHSELVGEGAYVKSKKTIGKIRVQVRNVKMGTEQPTGFTFTSLKSSSTGKLETFQQRLSNVKLVVSSNKKKKKKKKRKKGKNEKREKKEKNKKNLTFASTYELVQESYSCMLRLKSSSEEDALGMQPGPGEARVADISDESVLDLDLMGRSVVSVLYPGKKSMKKLRKIQLYINYSTTADNDSYKIPSFGESGITNYVLRPVHICSRNYRLRLCFGDCDERPTVSAQKLVATWFVEMVGGFICIFSGVLDAYTKLRYLSYVMDISTATVDYLDLVHDILLPVARFLGEVSVSVQIEQILNLVFENFKLLDESSMSGIKDVFGPATGLAAPALDPALKLYKWLDDILSPRLLREKGNRYAVLSYDASVCLCPHSWARSCMELYGFYFYGDCDERPTVSAQKLVATWFVEMVGGFICIFSGVLDAYTKLRYLSYVMDISTATVDYLDLVHDILLPVASFLGEVSVSVQIEQILTLVFENFKLRNILLKSEEKLTRKDHSELVGEGAYVKSKKTIGKIRVQVRNVKMGTEQPTGFTFTSLKSSSTGKLETFQQRSVAHLIVGTRGYLKEVPHANKAHQLMNWCKVADISDESVLDLDLMGRSVVSLLYLGKKSMKKLRKIQLYINYSTTADKDSYKIPSFGKSGITNYVLRPVHICSRNYRLRLCFGDCDERPTVSAQKLVATWFVEMVGGFICIFSGVLDAYTKLRYLSYVMDISTATVDYLDLVHDILLPVVIKDKSPFSGRRLAAPALDPALKLYKWLHDILSPRLRNILLKSEEKLTRKDHSELVGEGAYVKSKKTIGKIRVQVRNVKMGTEQPTGFTFTSLKSSSTGKLETFQQRSVAHLIVGTRGYLKEVPHANKAHQLMNWCKVADISDESVLDLDLMGRSVVSLLYLGKKSMKKLRKIQLYINYSTTADKDSYKIPSFGKSGITNYVLRPVHICSRNYRLRLCFGDCDERPTVSAQKLVATWFVEMVGGFICIFSGVLDAYTKLRYLSYVMDISTATVDYLDLVHDILLPVVIKDKSPFSGRRLAAPALDPALKLYKWLHDILSPSGLGNWLRNILLKSEEKLTRKDHSELVGEGAYVKSKKTIGKIRVQGDYVVADISDESVLDLDLMGRSVVSVLYPGKKSMKKLRKIQLYINYSTTADKDSYKIPSFGESGITNYVLRPVHICSRNYRLRLCFGVCDERPTVSAQKLVATWFVEMVGGFICIFSGVLDAYTKLRYLSYVMDISIATVDYLDLVHDILLPVVIKDKSPFSGRRLAAPALDPALKLYKWLHDILSPRLLREKGNWYAVLSYDASVHLCLHSWARSCMGAPPFLENECSLLRDVLGLRNILLKSEEELTRKDHSKLVGEGTYVTSKKTIGKIKVQVRKVKMGTEQPTGCMFTSLKSSSTVKLETFQQSASTYELVQESYSCLLRLKSSPEDDSLGMQPVSGESRVFYVFLPDGFGDDLIIEVHDSKGKYCGHALVQMADISDESGNKHCQCYISGTRARKSWEKYSYTSTIQPLQMKVVASAHTSVVENIAYDYVLETAMRGQQFQQRNLLLLHGLWKWFVDEFGVLDAYTKAQIPFIRPFSGGRLAAPALDQALKLYKWLHDILSPEVLSEGLSWMVSAVDDFGTSHIKLKVLKTYRF